MMDDTQGAIETITEQSAEETSLDLHASTNAEILQQMHALLGGMQGLRQDFDTKVKYDESKERLIDMLHKELQTYREGMHFKILRPLFIDLIAMYDDLGRVVDDLKLKAEIAPPQVLQNFLSFQETVEEILQRNGVEPFYIEETHFVANKQRVLKLVATSNPALDKQVARRVRKGFAYDTRILRPEVVEIYKYVPVE